jgi:hypothetical protein
MASFRFDVEMREDRAGHQPAMPMAASHSAAPPNTVHHPHVETVSFALGFGSGPH